MTDEYDHCSDLVDDLEKFDENDTVIHCADGIVKAPGYLLRARSPIFREQLKDEIDIHLEAYNEKSVKEFIAFMCYATVPVVNIAEPRTTFEILTLAWLHSLKGLEAELNKEIIEWCKESTSFAFDVLKYAPKSPIKEAALESIREDFRDGEITFDIKLDKIDQSVKTMVFDYMVESLMY
jgi:hypothetical protein